jgi:DNA primase
LAFFIPEDIIETIRNAADIVDVVSESVQLKKTGHHFMGLCPFHSEKTPSFSVNPSRAIFHCFGCGIGGNVFSFVMKRDGMSFPEAVRTLAGKYGISIPERERSPESRREESEREALYSVNRLAMDYFSSVLLRSEQGLIAREYLKERGMTLSIAQEFNLGFVPDGWDNLCRFFASRKIPRELAEKSGLIVSKNRERYYDRFRNRIIFPICDLSQRVIGFGGRVLDASLPKYLNSPETPVYNKSRSLYGFSRTRQALRETGTVHIVEGYFDFLALYMNGITNVVATLGTALTRDHVRMLSRSGVTKFVLVFDSDEAGIHAAARSIPVFQQEFVSANILVLPSTHDPDTYIRAFGAERFRAESENASGVVPFLSEASVKKHGLSIEGRIAVINDMKSVLAMVDDPVARSLYIRDLAHKIGVDEKAVHEKVREHAPAGRVHESAGRQDEMFSGADKQNHPPVSRFIDMERQIVSMMLQYPDIIEECRVLGVHELLEDQELKNIGLMVMEYNGELNDMAAVLTNRAADETTRRRIAGLAIGDIPYLYKNCVNLIHQYIHNRKKTENTLSQRIRLAEERNDQELLFQLIHEKNKLSKTMKNQGLSQKKIIKSGTGGGSSI